MEQYGTIRIRLQELLDQRGISKTRLGYRAEIRRERLSKFCKNEIAYLDIAALARLCTVLDCTVGDLLEYIPPEN